MKQPVMRFDEPSLGPEMSSYKASHALFRGVQCGRIHVETSEI